MLKIKLQQLHFQWNSPTCVQQLPRRPEISSGGKKGQSVISPVFIYRTRGEGGMCIALVVCQTKIRGAIGWGGISPMEAIGWQVHHWTQIAWIKKQLQHMTEARLSYQLQLWRIQTSQFQFFRRQYFISYQQLLSNQMWHFNIEIQF